MKKVILLAYLVLITYNMLCAQTIAAKPVMIGQMVPDVQVNNVRNHTQTSFKISDFKGKLVIFDFWDVNCIPCIQAFPKLDSLQKEFIDQIQIILVTKTAKNDLDKWYNVRKEGSALHRYTPNLVSVIQDTVLSKLFPHLAIPHSVWVNSTGVLQAVTQGHYVNSENIRKMLLDRNLKLPEKKEFFSYDSKKLSFPQIYIQYPEKLKYYSTLMQFIPHLSGSQSRFKIDSANMTVCIKRTGSILTFYGDIFSHYRAAGNPYDSPYYNYGKTVVLNVKDSTRLFFKGNTNSEEYDNWKLRNLYEYETVLPLMSEKKAYDHYLEDMNKFFGLEAKYEDREMKALVLVRTSNNEKFKSKASSFERSGGITKEGTSFIRNGSLLSIVGMLSENNKNKPYLFIDNTGYKGRVDIEIKSSLKDIEKVRRELNTKYDLDLVERNQMVPVLVISDKNKEY
ncbi:Thiol-disulfide isomerase or thioredoxin [Chryseobacterium profundimaris]|uniref:Thiol-disulfide isomerase or thioredoxin n=1 Tax=Chryseobacterium profundimaris TaxID=1387275 RepID=A0ABY1NYI1_9FLAO|nr:Thiol-disulfide isomerase or thioredoxin [Chryseobacterium profundimaris]